MYRRRAQIHKAATPERDDGGVKGWAPYIIITKARSGSHNEGNGVST